MSIDWKLSSLKTLLLDIEETSYQTYTFKFITNKWLKDLIKSNWLWSFNYDKKVITKWIKLENILTKNLFEYFDNEIKNMIKNSWSLNLLVNNVSKLDKKWFILNHIQNLKKTKFINY